MRNNLKLKWFRFQVDVCGMLLWFGDFFWQKNCANRIFLLFFVSVLPINKVCCQSFCCAELVSQDTASVLCLVYEYHFERMKAFFGNGEVISYSASNSLKEQDLIHGKSREGKD